LRSKGASEKSQGLRSLNISALKITQEDPKTLLSKGKYDLDSKLQPLANQDELPLGSIKEEFKVE
jgi:hypothetical protein